MSTVIAEKYHSSFFLPLTFYASMCGVGLLVLFRFLNKKLLSPHFSDNNGKKTNCLWIVKFQVLFCGD